MPNKPAPPNPMMQAMQYYIDRMGLARLHMQSQMPRQAAGVRTVSPMSGLERSALGPNVQAATWPGGVIRFNPTNLPADQEGIDDVLAHEYVHIGQQQAHGGVLSDIYHTLTQDADYNERPDEKAAYDYEKVRQSKRKDFNLSKGKHK